MAGARALAALSWTLALAGACAPDFEDATTIRDLRLLVVVADPPEVLVDVAWSTWRRGPPPARSRPRRCPGSA
jgi:hypothetical protein